MTQEATPTDQTPDADVTPTEPSRDPDVLRGRLDAQVDKVVQLRQRAQRAEATVEDLTGRLAEANRRIALYETARAHPEFTDEDLASCTETDPDAIRAWGDAMSAAIARHAGQTAKPAAAPARTGIDVRGALKRANARDRASK